jgi:DNA-directed RNA polymerase specialized sigma24 family protein
MDETADAMGISVQTVGRDWKLAQAWLAREMKRKKLPESDVK